MFKTSDTLVIKRLRFGDGTEYGVCLRRDDGVAQGPQPCYPVFHAPRHARDVRLYVPISVQPMGRPMSHSTQGGFSDPPATTFS